MKEIEVKILDIDPEVVIKKIESFGATKVFDGVMEISKYEFPDKRLAKRGAMLRLRTKGVVSELTYKEKIEERDFLSNREEEIKVDNHTETEAILSALGLEVVRKTSKHRISYHLGKASFEIDTFPGVPTFLEIEAPTSQEVKKLVEKFGYTMADTKDWTGRQVTEYYKKMKKCKHSAL